MTIKVNFFKCAPRYFHVNEANVCLHFVFFNLEDWQKRISSLRKYLEKVTADNCWSSYFSEVAENWRQECVRHCLRAHMCMFALWLKAFVGGGGSVHLTSRVFLIMYIATVTTLLQCTYFHQNVVNLSKCCDLSTLDKAGVLNTCPLSSWPTTLALEDPSWMPSPVSGWCSSIIAVNRDILVPVGLDATCEHTFLIQNGFTQSIITNQYIAVWHWSLDCI